MEFSSNIQNKNLSTLYSLDITNFLDSNESDNSNSIKFKIPRLYETWNWEGDLSILPNKWLDLIKNSDLSLKNEINKTKEYIKSEYYNNEKFDKKSFYFLTHRSEVAGCFYLNKFNFENDSNIIYCIEFLLLNIKKHANKGVEEGLIGLAIKRAIELICNNKEKFSEINSIYLDLSTSNININKLEEIGFKISKIR